MLSLPGASSVRSTLELRGGPPLQAGATHALRVVGCLQSSPDLCGTAEVSVTLRDSPLVARLAGGNRAVGVDDAGCSLMPPPRPTRTSPPRHSTTRGAALQRTPTALALPSAPRCLGSALARSATRRVASGHLWLGR